MCAPSRMAIKAALMSESRFMVGCVVTKGRRIIGLGFNDMNKGHTKMGKTKKIHAEMRALGSCRCDVHGYEAWIARVSFRGSLALARPCPLCVKSLKDAGIKRVHYTTNSDDWATEEI